MNDFDFELLKSLLNAQNIDFYAYLDDPLTGEKFDMGLRSKLYADYDYNKVLEILKKNCKTGEPYTIRDIFGVNYFVIYNSINEANKENEENEDVFLIAGPYFNDIERPNPELAVIENNLELHHTPIIKMYFNQLPIGVRTDELIKTFIEKFINNGHMRINYLDLDFGEASNSIVYHIEKPSDDEVREIELRYYYEKKLMEAVATGNRGKALQVLKEMNKISPHKRSADSFFEHVNFLNTVNVLFRKAAEQARVHPVHIDSTSYHFIRRIRLCRTENELNVVFMDMLKVYCHIVQNHSMEKYTETIENIVNYIEFNFQENLSLNVIAEKYVMNPSYLSRKFKAEVGESLTSYINNKKVQKSLYFLTTSKLTIQEVSELVGVLDENYFSRIFKKYTNTTPKKYRDSMKEN